MQARGIESGILARFELLTKTVTIIISSAFLIRLIIRRYILGSMPYTRIITTAHDLI